MSGWDSDRTCADCYHSCARDEYSKNQWSKGAGYSRCVYCVGNYASSSDSDSDSCYRTCANCSLYLDSSEYSNNQWSKGDGTSRCSDCVTASQNNNHTKTQRQSRECAACHSNWYDNAYSRNQWAKGAGVSRCSSCIQQGNPIQDPKLYRTCGMCNVNLYEDEYSANQWSRGEGYSACKSCVAKKIESNTTAVRRACVACEHNLGRDDFSKNQWNRGVGNSRCSVCVQEGHSSPLEARSAARNNNATTATYEDRVVFAKGAHRNVYKGVYTSGYRSGQDCVVKKFQDTCAYESSYFDTDIAVIDKVLAVVCQFNDLGVIDKTIRLNRATVWTCTPNSEKALVEPFILNWTKFNSNSGWTADSSQVWNRVMQALSHFSYHITGGSHVVCDLQGGVYSTGAVLSDPVVLSRDQSFGPTDLGPQGISTFFSKHVCNQYCRRAWSRPANPRRLINIVKGTTMTAVPTQFGAVPFSVRRW